ncbi:MAG: hypothetical protein MJ217_01760 [Bacilli bacterium]|nr:hypothetical protein [Bacilli bacterium]
MKINDYREKYLEYIDFDNGIQLFSGLKFIQTTGHEIIDGIFFFNKEITIINDAGIGKTVSVLEKHAVKGETEKKLLNSKVFGIPISALNDFSVKVIDIFKSMKRIDLTNMSDENGKLKLNLYSNFVTLEMDGILSDDKISIKELFHNLMNNAVELEK